MSIQTDIDSLMGGGVSVFNLALNVAGIINNKQNVSLYTIDEKTGGKGKNILEGSLGVLGGVTGIASMVDDTGVVMSADIIEDCKLTEHPLEDGKVIADNKVILPTEIVVRVSLQPQDYKDRLDEIQRYKRDREMICVETKFNTYKNMQIVGLPCTLNVENVNRLTFNIKLREVLIMAKEGEVTENVSDMNTKNMGTLTGVEVPLNTELPQVWSV